MTDFDSLPFHDAVLVTVLNDWEERSCDIHLLVFAKAGENASPPPSTVYRRQRDIVASSVSLGRVSLCE